MYSSIDAAARSRTAASTAAPPLGWCLFSAETRARALVTAGVNGLGVYGPGMVSSHAGKACCGDSLAVNISVTYSKSGQYRLRPILAGPVASNSPQPARAG